MPLQIVTDIRDALDRGDPIKESELRALIASHEQLWQQLQGQPSRVNRASYMRQYMRTYRARKRLEALLTAASSSSEIH